MESSSHDQAASDTSDPVDLGLASPQSLHHALYARRSEYTRPHRIRVKVGTWNVAASPGTDKDLASWFIDGGGLDTKLAGLNLSHNTAVDTHTTKDSVLWKDESPSARLLGGDKIGLYVLGLQEIVTLNPVTQYVYSESNPTDKWRQALEAALPEGYQFVASEHMSGLLLLLYASPEVAACVGDISTRSVGTGVGGWMGNKGATMVRIVLGETTRLVFVDSHLSSGSDPATVERRCWDVKTILDRARFDPVIRPGDDSSGSQEKIGDEDFVFWFGDLNFRLDDIPGDDIRRLLTLHTNGQYDVSRPVSNSAADNEEGVIIMRSSDSSDDHADAASGKSRSTNQTSDPADSESLPDPDDFEPDAHGDPASLQATLDSLLPHDQLQRVMKQRKIFHDGWREGPISFLPSYKYDVGTVGLFDTSEKKRAPSWCDRILFRTRLEKERYEAKVKEEQEARKRDEEMEARGIDHAADDDEVLFDYDPDNDGDPEPPPTGQPGLDYDEYDEAGDDAVVPGGGGNDGAEKVKLEVYTSHQRITSSDHKPVVAIFTMDFDAVIPELKAEVHAEVARELDRAENESRPSITIASEGQHSSDDSIDFGEVHFLEKRAAYFTFANTGRVSATISFVERPATEDGQDSPSDLAQWLTTSLSRAELSEENGDGPELGQEVTLEPGETVNATIQVLVDKPSQTRLLNDGRARLEDVLVLRVVDGRDHFLPVRVNWVPTCIGRSIDELVRIPDGGIRDFVKEMAAKKGGKQIGAIPYDCDVHRSAPKELFKLIEALEVLTDRTLADEQMLGSYTIPRDKNGWPFESHVGGPHENLLAKVVDTLDTDRPITDAFPAETNPCQRLETVAEALLMFLRGLTDGVVSMTLWSKIEQAPVRALNQAPPPSSGASAVDVLEDDKMAILDVLANAPNHNISFVFLTTTLAKVIGELAPLKKTESEVLQRVATTASAAQPVIGAIGALGRRSLSLRRSLTGGGVTAASSMVEGLAAMERRKAREKRVAGIFGKVVCRAPATVREKERKALEGKQSMVMELFLRGRDGG